MNSRPYVHYAFRPTDTKICRLTFERPVASDPSMLIVDTDEVESVVVAGGQQRMARATNELTISCLEDGDGNRDNSNSFVQNDEFRREWVVVCEAIGAALQHTNLVTVRINLHHSFRMVQVAPGIVQLVIGDKSDWIIRTILGPLRGIPTLRSVHITTSSPPHMDFNQLGLTLEAIASFVNLESLVIGGFETMSPGSMTTLATALQTPTTFPALASLTLEPPRDEYNPNGDFQVGEECPPELVEPFSDLVEAIRTKHTLQDVHVRADWIDHSTNVKLQTFPSIHRAIRSSGLIPVPAPQRRPGPGEDIRDLLLSPTGSPEPPTLIRVMKDFISDIRDRLLPLANGSPDTPEDATDGLFKWIHAMEHFVEDEDQFACFHFFFSKIDATEYINNSTNLEAVLSGEYVPRPSMLGELKTLFREWYNVIQAILVCIAAVVVFFFGPCTHE